MPGRLSRDLAIDLRAIVTRSTCSISRRIPCEPTEHLVIVIHGPPTSGRPRVCQQREALVRFTSLRWPRCPSRSDSARGSSASVMPGPGGPLRSGCDIRRGQARCGVDPQLRERWSPIVLHDDSLSNDFARVITDICLVQRVLNVHTGRGEVSEVHYRHEVEVAFKVAGIIPARQSEQLRDLAQCIEGISICVFRLG